MLYLESPGGIGYTISQKDDRDYNDMSQSEDAYKALVSFFKKFPDFL